jgi:hypothetical protein
MTKVISIYDESMTGKTLNEILLNIEQEIFTVRELIKLRIEKEVATYNNHPLGFFKGLVQPSEAELTLNGFKLKKPQAIDAEKQYYTALQSFQKNGFFILIDNRQVEDLDEEVIVQADTRISFIKLTPLVGG